MIRVAVKLFGAFRKYGDGREVTLDLEGPMAVREVKQALARKLDAAGVEQLLAESVLATGETILSDDQVIGTECSLAVLPPVCGG
jgi:molybdopterin converting factor small subunit